MQQLRHLHGPGQFFRLFGKTMKGGFTMASKGAREMIHPTFAERIMLAVTGVNQCAYCTYLHTRTSLEKGMSEEEIQKLLSGEFSDLPQHESAAILYAQHYAETEGSPSEKAVNRIIEMYGKDGLKYINSCINAVYFGNMCSNTVYCFREQSLKGVPVKIKLAYVLSLPVAFFIKAGSGKKD